MCPGWIKALTGPAYIVTAKHFVHDQVSEELFMVTNLELVESQTMSGREVPTNSK